jgi:hypothetical protein
VALIYKSVIEWKSDIKELLQSDLKDWAGQLKFELSWPNTELITPDLNVSLHELIDNDATFTELIVSGPAHQDRRTSILIYESTAKSVVCIEEVENKSLKLEYRLPEPSQLVQRVLASMPPVVHNLIVADIQRKPLVALIGDINDFGVLIDDMKRRIGHMANIVVLQEHRVPSLWNRESDIRKGSLIWSLTGTHVNLYLPAQPVQKNPVGAIRRIQAEVLQIRSSDGHPAEIIEAIKKLREASGEVDPWVEEVARLDRLVKQKDDDHGMLALELEDALARLDQIGRSYRYLLRGVMVNGSIAAVEIEENDDDINVNVTRCEEALEYAEELLPNLFISPEAFDHSRVLDESPMASVWAKSSWEGLCALHDYVKAKADGQFRGNFLSYCSDTPPGYRYVAPNKVALKESESTMNSPAKRRAREFSVPTTVSSDGSQLMEPHLKVFLVGADVPRMHFYDDTTGSTKKIIVGYLGKHLPT